MKKTLLIGVALVALSTSAHAVERFYDPSNPNTQYSGLSPINHRQNGMGYQIVKLEPIVGCATEENAVEVARRGPKDDAWLAANKCYWLDVKNHEWLNINGGEITRRSDHLVLQSDACVIPRDYYNEITTQYENANPMGYLDYHPIDVALQQYCTHIVRAEPGDWK
jgi:hypothetical protein